MRSSSYTRWRTFSKALHTLLITSFVVLIFAVVAAESQGSLDIAHQAESNVRQDLNDLESELGPEYNEEAIARRKADLDAHLAKRNVLKRVLSLKRELKRKRTTVESLSGEVSQDKKIVEDGRTLMHDREKERHRIAEERKAVEQTTSELRGHINQLKQALDNEEAAKSNLDHQSERLEKEKDDLHKRAEELTYDFKRHGFETWMSHNIDMFPDVVQATLKKSADLLEPVVEAVEEAAEANSHLTAEVTQRITQYVPLIRQSPFYTGMLFYLVLLCPLVVSVALVLRVNKHLSFLSVQHYILVGNLYFGAMSVVLFLMSVLSGTDILIVFQHRSRGTAESFMVLNAFLYIIHLFLHARDIFVSKTTKTWSQLICALLIGAHFYYHAYKRAILHQDPHIGALAYFLYAILFLYTLYDRGIDYIEIQLSKKNRYEYTNGSGGSNHYRHGSRTNYRTASRASTGDAARFI